MVVNPRCGQSGIIDAIAAGMLDHSVWITGNVPEPPEGIRLILPSRCKGARVEVRHRREKPTRTGEKDGSRNHDLQFRQECLYVSSARCMGHR